MRFSLVVAAALATASGKIIKSPNGELIEGEFIIILRDNATKADRANHIALLGDAEILYTYDNLFTGYAVRTSEHVMERVSEHPDVLMVEQNGVARALQACAQGNPNPPEGLWGLSRVSYRDVRNPRHPVRYQTTRGADIYIMDTGINYGHVDFPNGRARFAFDATNEGPSDQNGHGTHCAGTAGGAFYGISKGANIFDVKVLGRGGSGSWAGVVSGIDFVGGQPGPLVGSMSLGGGINQPANEAVTRLSQRNAIVSIASGNNNGNSCSFSPASAPGALTVNAIANNDARSGFSNWGTCSHIFAPGQNVLSSWIGSPTATNTISGTSMACPHVTGVVSDMWSSDSRESPAEVRARLIRNAIPNVVTNPGTGSPNFLVQAACASQPGL